MKKRNYIIAGIVAIVVSWVFANLSIESKIESWYALASVVFGIGGLFTILIVSIES